jgi:hypothetical protein
MHQADMWHDTIFDALGAAVQAAGGPKKVSGKLWPSLDSTSATARLRACMNPEHAQKLCLDEFLMIQRLARDAGDTSLMQFQARELGCRLEVLSPVEAKKQAKRARRLALLEELKRLEEE